MTFTIDTDNNIAAHAGQPASAENLQSFASYPGTGQTHRGLAGHAPGRNLEQLRRSRPVQRPSAGQEVHEPKVCGRADLGGGSASLR